MFKSKKITAIAVALLLAVCLTGGTVAALAASTNSKGNGYIDEQEDAALTAEKQGKKDEIPLDANGNPAAPGGRGSRIQATENANVATQGVKGNGEIDEQEDAALTAQKQKDEIPLDANGNPVAPGGRGSRLEINANPSVAAQGENAAVQKGNGDVDEQEDAALTAKKQNGEIALDANGNPAAPGGRGSRLR